jgi:hypothetical protein
VGCKGKGWILWVWSIVNGVLLFAIRPPQDLQFHGTVRAVESISFTCVKKDGKDQDDD